MRGAQKTDSKLKSGEKLEPGEPLIDLIVKMGECVSEDSVPEPPADTGRTTVNGGGSISQRLTGSGFHFSVCCIAQPNLTMQAGDKEGITSNSNWAKARSCLGSDKYAESLRKATQIS